MVALVDDYVVSKKGPPMYKHLADLYETDKETFYWMVRNKCREYYKKYNTARRTISVLREEIQNDFLDYQLAVVEKKLALIESAYKKAKNRKYHRSQRKTA